MYSEEVRERDLKKLITVTNAKDSLGIPFTKGWGWVGWEAGFQENISVRVSAASAHQLPPHIGHLDYEEALMQAWPRYLPHDTCPTRELCLNFFKAVVTQEQLRWHFHSLTISGKQWLARFIFLTAATENVVHLMDSSWKADTYIPNKTLEIYSLWWHSLPWHMILFLVLLVRKWRQGVREWTSRGPDSKYFHCRFKKY